MHSFVSLVLMLGAIVFAAPPGVASAQTTGQSVVTYHNDSLRTGWNAREHVLKTSNVTSSTFGLLKNVPLDGQVDAQPLVLAAQSFTAGKTPGVYDIAYVVTENDSVYAIDTATGTILASRHLGTPVPQTSLPGQCNNNSNQIGITATPTIDQSKNLLYLIADTYENGRAVFRIHALDTRTLADGIAPAIVTATHTLANGKTVGFAPAVERQRAALLEANGTVYAAFASYCDVSANVSRGWILGWNAASLAPIATNDVTDRFANSSSRIFLDAIWMSGAGIASDQSGSLFFVTSNSDPKAYNGSTDVQESAVREASDLSGVQSLFTVSDQATLDSNDDDFGSGGILLIPSQKTGSIHELAVAAGKDGQMFLLNRQSLGGFSSSGNNVLGTYSIGGCWCAESYYVGNDAIPRIVTSGGGQVGIWQLQTTPTIGLKQQSASASISTGQDPGFFTSISSNATVAGSAVVWAVSRPTDGNPADVDLYAFDPTTASTIYSAVAGTWPYTTGNANLVPTVANGKVLVASYEQLAIFGPLAKGAAEPRAALVGAPLAALAPGTHEVYGRIVALSGTQMMLRTRSGRTLTIDIAAAQDASATPTLYPGKSVVTRLAAGTRLVATSILRAKPSPALWGPDR